MDDDNDDDDHYIYISVYSLFQTFGCRKFPDFKGKLQALYIRSRLPFPEVELFVQQAVSRYVH